MSGGFVPLEGSLKSVAAVISSLIIIYTAMWGLGVAPITNGRAAEMVNDAVKQNNEVILEQIEKIQQVQRGYGQTIGEINRDLDNVKKSNDRIDSTVNEIYQLLIRRGSGGGPNN